MRMPGIPGMSGMPGMGGGNPFGAMGRGGSDMDMLRAMEQQMRNKR